MNEIDFEGTLAPEKLTAIGKVEDFFEAVDTNDFGKAILLMKRGNVDSETIEMVLKKMANAVGDH